MTTSARLSIGDIIFARLYDKFIAATVCLGIILAATGLVWKLGLVQGVQDEQRLSSAHSHVGAIEQVAQDRCSTQKQSELFECLYAAIDASEEMSHSEQDLIAQQRAAAAAMVAAAASVISMVVGAFAVVGLLRQIRQTDRSIAIAYEANTNAREAAHKQLRAYVTAEVDYILLVRRAGGAPLCRVGLKFENLGATPALKMRSNTRALVRAPHHPPPGAFAFKFREEDAKSKSTLGSEKSKHVSKEFTIRKGNLARMIAADRMFFLYGTLQYEDVFGQQQHTNYCFFLRPIILLDNYRRLYTEKQEDRSRLEKLNVKLAASATANQWNDMT